MTISIASLSAEHQKVYNDLMKENIALQSALREALDEWEGYGIVAGMNPEWPGWERIDALRARFLES